MSPHSDTLSWFRANKSLLFLLNAAYLAEKSQMPKIYHTWGEHADHYTTDAVYSQVRCKAHLHIPI